MRKGENPDAAFRRVFEMYYRPVFRFFEKRGFSTQDSHDLTQETFIRVYSNIGTFRREAPLGAWLFQIAANIFRNTLRQQSTQKRVGQQESAKTVEVSRNARLLSLTLNTKSQGDYESYANDRI